MCGYMRITRLVGALSAAVVVGGAGCTQEPGAPGKCTIASMGPITLNARGSKALTDAGTAVHFNDIQAGACEGARITKLTIDVWIDVNCNMMVDHAERLIWHKELVNPSPADYLLGSADFSWTLQEPIPAIILAGECQHRPRAEDPTTYRVADHLWIVRSLPVAGPKAPRKTSAPSARPTTTSLPHVP